MSLRIKTNTIAQVTQASLRKVDGQQNNVMEKLLSTEKAKPRILNADIAMTLTELVAANIKTASRVSVFVQANMSLKNVKKLLG